MTDGRTQDYPGQRLGRPASGPGSVASWRIRILALFIDWFASLGVSSAIVGFDDSNQLTLLIFWVEAAFLTSLVGGSFGQIATRIAVTRLDGRPVSLLRSLGRWFLVCLVIPPLIYDPDRRGLHDLAADTLVVRR